MNEIILNIIGLISAGILIAFVASFYKNHRKVDDIPVEEIKMKVKVNLTKPSSEEFGTYSENVQKQKATQAKKIRDPVYFSFNYNTIINDERLEYLGKSKKSGYPVYAIDKSNVNILRGTKYTEIINIQKEL